MELSKLVYLAVAALAAGIVMFFASSKERNEKGEWGNGLQWAYLLMMIGVFGILALWVEWSLTAVLLAFTVFPGAAKGSLKKPRCPTAIIFATIWAVFSRLFWSYSCCAPLWPSLSISRPARCARGW